MGSFFNGCFSVFAVIFAIYFFSQNLPILGVVALGFIVVVILGIRNGLKIRKQQEQSKANSNVFVIHPDTDDDLEGDIRHHEYKRLADEKRAREERAATAAAAIAAAAIIIPLTDDQTEQSALASDSEELQTYNELDTDLDEGDYI